MTHPPSPLTDSPACYINMLEGEGGTHTSALIPGVKPRDCSIAASLVLATLDYLNVSRLDPSRATHTKQRRTNKTNETESDAEAGKNQLMHGPPRRVIERRYGSEVKQWDGWSQILPRAAFQDDRQSKAENSKRQRQP